MCNSDLFLSFEGPLVSIPKNRAEVYATFGNPGVGRRPNRRWARKNMVVARNLPLVGKKYCHVLAEPYIREALGRLEDAGYDFETVGCFAWRHQRHNPRKPLSYHAWGIALDIDPRHNRARSFQAGNRPKNFSIQWRQTWPLGIDKEVVDIMKAVGFTWGGDWTHFVDPMHFQLVGV